MSYNYNPSSQKAEEFINHEEILETLSYAEKNKNNVELIDQILAKARLRKGLRHREAAVLLDCEIPEKVEELFELARQIKQDFYGNRIVMFAPLYLSNYCVNGCVYCPYHMKNKHIARKKLTQEEIRREVIALQDMGHKRLALETGEDPVNNPIEYVLDSIKTIYSIKHKNGAIRRVNVNIAATTVENYRKLKEAGIGTYILEQDVRSDSRLFQLPVILHRRRRNIDIDPADRPVFMLDTVNCLDTVQHIFNRIVDRILARLQRQTFMSHILKRNYLPADFLLRQLLSGNVLIFHVVWTVHAAIHAVIRQIQRCKHDDPVSVEILLDLARQLKELLHLFRDFAVKKHCRLAVSQPFSKPRLRQNLVNQFHVVFILLGIGKSL